MKKSVLVFTVMLVLSIACLPGHASGMTLEQAKEAPGVYIMNGDRFTPLVPPAGRTMVVHTFYTVCFNNKCLLFDLEHEINTLLPEEQLVLIGVTNAEVNRINITAQGYTVDGSVRISMDGTQVQVGQKKFELINDENPALYLDRLISFIIPAYVNEIDEGVLDSKPNEAFIFGLWSGTDYCESVINADKKYYIFEYDAQEVKASEIEKTKNGYFKLNLLEPLGQHYVISFGSSQAIFRVGGR